MISLSNSSDSPKSLSRMISNIEKIRKLLQDFLSTSDLLNLSLASKRYLELVRPLYTDTYLKKYNNFMGNLLQPKKKNNNYKLIQTESNTIMKTSLFNLPSNIMLNSGIWGNHINSQKELRILLKDDKFIVENNNVFFRNPKGDILFLNRSLLDESLNYESFDQRSEEDLKKENYEKFYMSNGFGTESYDFTNMQSLLQRQKNLIENYEQKTKKSTTTLTMQERLVNLAKIKRISVILCHGGNFSVGVFEGEKCIFHKSDHKYVTRKKAGQRQLGKDKNAGSNIKSMGSQIRRENEKKHQEKVSNILTDNIKLIGDSDIVFLQAPGLNKLLLVNENEPLFQIRNKLRSVCLTAKKANYTEVERIFKIITKAYVVLPN